jgi:hypothetical protein
LTPAGEVSAATRLVYHEDGDVVWARYTGGAVVLGFLVGTRHADRLEFRYSQLNADGETSSGYCTAAIEALPDGRLRLAERWRWESRDGAGESAVEELVEARPGPLGANALAGDARGAPNAPGESNL